MRILSLDIGYKKTGIAISSVDQKVIFPFELFRLEKFHGKIFFEDLKKHLKDYWDTFDTVVLGNPYNSDFENEICQYIMQVYRIFKAWTDWNVIFVSETNSSYDSRDFLKKLNFSKKKIRKNTDSYAALILLNDFLESNNKKSAVSF